MKKIMFILCVFIITGTLSYAQESFKAEQLINSTFTIAANKNNKIPIIDPAYRFFIHHYIKGGKHYIDISSKELGKLTYVESPEEDLVEVGQVKAKASQIITISTDSRYTYERLFYMMENPNDDMEMASFTIDIIQGKLSKLTFKLDNWNVVDGKVTIDLEDLEILKMN